MKYCEGCRTKKGWIKSQYQFPGTCELCSKVGDCYELPTKLLPMTTDKYDVCPLQQAGFRLKTFSELPPKIIGPDGKCICTINQRCLNVDKYDGLRCTVEQLEQLDKEAGRRRAWQSGGDW